MALRKSDLIAIALLAAGAAGFVLMSREPAASGAEAGSGPPQLIAATFNSAWCASCKIVKPRLRKVVPDFAGEPVRFVEYDLTFGPEGAPRDAADADGLSFVYERFSRSTGYALLVDAETGEIYDMLTVNHSADAMRKAIARALEKARASGAPSPAPS